jgi:hypothetical protein
MRKKKCTICKRCKFIKDFNKKKSSSDGHQPHCRECNRKSSRTYYHSNRKHHKKVTIERHKKQRNMLQKYVYDFLKVHSCVDCPENDPCCLDFDHQRDKKELISKMVSAGVALSTLIEEMNKCVVRCSNCHRKKTAKDFNWYKNIDTGSSPNGMVPAF